MRALATLSDCKQSLSLVGLKPDLVITVRLYHTAGIFQTNTGKVKIE